MEPTPQNGKLHKWQRPGDDSKLHGRNKVHGKNQALRLQQQLRNLLYWYLHSLPRKSCKLSETYSTLFLIPLVRLIQNRTQCNTHLSENYFPLPIRFFVSPFYVYSFSAVILWTLQLPHVIDTQTFRPPRQGESDEYSQTSSIRHSLYILTFWVNIHKYTSLLHGNTAATFSRTGFRCLAFLATSQKTRWNQLALL